MSIDVQAEYDRLQDESKMGQVPSRRFLAKILWNARKISSDNQREGIISGTRKIADRFYPAWRRPAA